MGLTRIEAPSYRDAMRQIDERFGRDVSVVHTRVIRRRGFMGLLGATGVEVYVTGKDEYLAWRDRGAVIPPGPSGYPVGPTSVPGTPPASGRPSDPLPDARNGVTPSPAPQHPRDSASRPPAGSVPAQPPGGKPPARKRPVSRDQLPSQEGREVMDMLRDLQRQVRFMVRHGGADGGKPVHHPVLLEAARILDEESFSEESKEPILAALAHRRLPGTSEEPDEIRSLAKIQLTELLRPKIPVCMPISIDAPGSDSVLAPPAPAPGPRVVVLVGPTGVGKTTTIAKLISPLHLKEKKRVGLVTLDTYRIGAVEQLGRYAEIVGLSLEVVDPGEPVRDKVEKLQGADIVFVDTAGRSQRDRGRLEEIRDMLSDLGNLETHLCLPMTAARENLLEVVESFRTVSYDRVLLTKADEAPRGGVLFEVLQKAAAPVSYLTCGQEVPDDIQVATEERLLQLMVGR